MAKNYLPFARRQVVTLDNSANRFSTRITDLSIGGGVRAHLGDLCVAATYASGTTPNMRIGILGKGYLTEGFYTAQLHNTGTTNEYGVWEFTKPYRLYPGERLKAKFEWRSNDPFNSSAKQPIYRPAVTFFGKRVKDGHPINLYDSYVDAVPTVGQSYLLFGDNLQCPADTPVDLYKMIGPTCAYPHMPWQYDAANPSFQIWGPDDRAWWDDPTWTQITVPPVTLINLNKPEWVLDPKDTVTIEFDWPSTLTRYVVVTLRGSMEIA